MRRTITLALMIGALLMALGMIGQDTFRTDGTVDAATRTKTVRWGPYTIPAAMNGMPGMTDNQLDWFVELPCRGCYITSISPNLVYADGTKANINTGAMLHHMVGLNHARSDATCSGEVLGLLGERFFASGNERTVMSMPDGYGYYSGWFDSWSLIVDLMNMKPYEQTVYLEFTFEYRPGWENVKHVKPIWLDIDNCGDSEVNLTAGHHDVHWDWTSNREGYIVGIGGHVHDWGIDISAQNVNTGEIICDSVAGYAAGSPFAPEPIESPGPGHAGAANVIDPGDPTYVGRIEDMTTCRPNSGVHSGDTIRLHTQYNLAQDYDGAMGIMIAYMHETNVP